MTYNQESEFLNLNKVFQHFEYQSLTKETLIAGQAPDEKQVYEGMTQNTYLFVTQKAVLIDDIQNISTYFTHKFVHPVEGIRTNVVQEFPFQKVKDRVCYIFQKYQEQPSLLDGILQQMIEPIMNAIKLYLYKLLGKEEVVCEYFHSMLSIIYQLTKVRGKKYTVKYFPHEVKDLEPTISYLVKSREQPGNWESSYVIMMWLTVIILVPFDLSTIDSKSIEIRNSKGEKIQEMVELLMQVSKYYLRATTKLKQAAAIFLSKLFTRPDIQKRHVLQQYIGYVLEHLKVLSKDQDNTFFVCGLYESLYQIFKNVSRSELLQFIPTILQQIRDESSNQKENPAKKLIKMKLLTRIGLVYLKPRVAKWAYKKSKASLKDNLKSTVSNKLVTNTSTSGGLLGTSNFGDDNENQLEYYRDVNKASLEEIIDLLIEALVEKETNIRQAASKGIGKIAGRLSPDMILDILEYVFNLSSSPQTQHSICLTLAQLIRRNLLSPEKLQSLYPFIAQSLLYQKQEGGYSIGQAVRDAACYMTWAVARGYQQGGKELGIYLMTAACFDRQVGCRRAASAAYQQLVGRVGDVPNGIEILTQADYFTLGMQKNSYLNVGIFVASYQPYFKPFAENLGYQKLRHWDTEIKRIAACSLGLMCPLNPDFMAKELLPSLVSYLQSDAMNVRLGSLIGIGQILIGLAGKSQQHQLHDQMKDSVFLRSLTQNQRKLLNAGEYMTAFKQRYQADRYLDNVGLIDRSVLRDIIETIKDYINKNVYKGKAGQAFRLATCRLLECISMINIPLQPQQVSIFNTFLQDNIKNPLESILHAAVKCLSKFSVSYHTGQVYEKLINNLINNATLATPQAKGYTLGLSSLSRPVYIQNYQRIMKVIENNCKILKEKEDDADRRKNSIIVLKSMVESIGFADHVLTEHELKRVFDLLDKAMGDYSIDKRGDIGSIVREASMKSLSRIVQVYCQTPNKSVILSSQLVYVMVCNLLQQLSEKIDRIRLLAGSLLQKYFDQHNKHFEIPNGAHLEQVFKQETIRQLVKASQFKFDKTLEPQVMEMEMKIQETIFQEKTQQLIYYWNLPHCVFAVVVPLLKLKAYSYAILKGLSTSLGGISESVIKYSRQQLCDYIASVGASQEYEYLDYLVGDCVTILQKYYRNQRMVVPMYNTLDFLFEQQDITSWEGLKKHTDRLASILIKQLAKSKMIGKISAGVGLFVHLVSLGQQQIKVRVLPYIVQFLCSDLPNARKILADRLLLMVMTQMDYNILDQQQSEQLTSLIQGNDFLDQKMKTDEVKTQLQKILRIPTVPTIPTIEK